MNEDLKFITKAVEGYLANHSDRGDATARELHAAIKASRGRPTSKTIIDVAAYLAGKRDAGDGAADGLRGLLMKQLRAPTVRARASRSDLNWTNWTEIVVDELLWAADSSDAYAKAEEAAAGSGRYPDYPAPFKAIGSGWGPLFAHVEKLAYALALEMNVDFDGHRDTGSVVMQLRGGTPEHYAAFEERLQEQLADLKSWVQIKGLEPPRERAEAQRG